MSQFVTEVWILIHILLVGMLFGLMDVIMWGRSFSEEFHENMALAAVLVLAWEIAELKVKVRTQDE